MKFRIGRCAAIAAVISVFAAVGPARSYGPATHIGEAMRYIEMLTATPLAGPRGDLSILDNPLYRPYLKLGSTFPDIGRVLPDRYFEPHDRFFAWHVYEKAVDEYGADPWKLAFAVGYLMHVGGDTSAQVIVTPRLAVRGGWGELSVFDGVYDDHPGGENELLVEGWLDILYGDFSHLIELFNVFVVDAHLDEVLDFYREAGEEYFGPPPTQDVAADRAAARRFLEDLEWVARNAVGDPLIDARLWIDAGMMERVYHGPAAAAAGGLINGEEWNRLIEGPAFADPAFWDEYPESYKDLGPTYVREFEPGGGWYDNWPTWTAETMKAGSLESLAGLREDVYRSEADIMVYDLDWTDGDDHALPQIDAGDPPDALRARVELFVTADVDTTVTARIRRHIVGVDPAADPIVASASVDLDFSPFDGDTVDRPVLTVEAEPVGDMDDTWGFVLDLVTEDEPDKPFFTTNFDAFFSLEAVDVTGIGAYELLYDTYDKWPRSVRVIGQAFPSGLAVARINVVDDATGRKAPDAVVDVGARATVSANAHGYTETVLAAGDYSLSATSPVHVAGEPAPITLSAGEEAWFVVSALPRPIVYDDLDFASGAGAVAVRWEASELVGSPARFETALGTSAGEDDVSAWGSAGRSFDDEIAFERVPTDGTMVYASVRVATDLRDYPAGSSDGFVVDASPPAAPTIVFDVDNVHRNGGRVTGVVSAEDAHSEIASYRLSWSLSEVEPPVESMDVTAPAFAFDVGPVPYGHDTVFVFAAASNGAGLWSPIGGASLPVNGDPWPDDDADDDSVDDDVDDDAADDDSADDDAPAGSDNDDDDDGCGC